MSSESQRDEPTLTSSLEGFFEPRHAPAKLRTADKLYKAFDDLVEKKGGRKGNQGELLKTISLSQSGVEAVIFDITNRQQIGFVGCHLLSGNRGFTTGASISRKYMRRGYGYLAVSYINTLVASFIQPGAPFFEVNTARPESRQAINQILLRQGARRVAKKFEGKYDCWERFVPNPMKKIPLTVDGTRLLFKAPTTEALDRMRAVEDLSESEGRFFYRGKNIGVINNQTITIPRAEVITDLDFWQGVDLLWQQSVKSGLKVDLDL